MAKFDCVICRCEFLTKPAYYNGGLKRTCSKECSSKLRSKTHIGLDQSYKHNHRIEISNDLRSVIDGEMLGDGNLGRQADNAYFQYGTKSEEYITFLRNLLICFNPTEIIKRYNIKNPQGDVYDIPKAYFYFKTKTNPTLTDIHSRWYINHKKIIPKDLILDPLICRSWYIGDGSINRNQIHFCTNSFSLEEQQFLMNQLKEIGFDTYLITCNRKWQGNARIQYNIGLSTYSTEKFLRYIGPCLVRYYNYKWKRSQEITDYFDYPYATSDVAKLLKITEYNALMLSKRKWFKETGIKTKRVYGRLRFEDGCLEKMKQAHLEMRGEL